MVLVVVGILFGSCGTPDVAPVQDEQQAVTQGAGAGSLAECETGADLAENPDCRFVAYVNSINTFWDDSFAARNARYRPAVTTVFTGQVTTDGCGSASSAVGPFYCPADETVYFDLTFFDELERVYGASGGDFADAYVIAHEYGHHISNLTGSFDKVRTQRGPESDAVRLELQADCYAGIWASGAEEGTGPNGEPFLLTVTEEDIAEGLDAARVVGDDDIQQAFQGSVSPETWTHGSSQQRQRWFRIGYESGDFATCDTFRATTL
jgi:predicted metalloprotease